jgi:hypothetical protein
MKLSHTVRLLSAVTIVLLAQPAISPTVAQEQDRGATSDSDVAKTSTQGHGLDSVLGREIRTQEDDMGRIIDLLADRNGQVQAAVIELGGFLGIGTRKIAVEWSALRFDASGKQPVVILEMNREQLRAAPEYIPGEPIVLRKADN